MSFEPVNIHISDGQNQPVAGVLVKVYDPTGQTFFTQALSDGAGVASFLLETLSYSIRFYKFQTGFSQPQQLTVLPHPATNDFNVRAEPFVPPLATDPRLCRASGFFRDITGAPRPWLDMHFTAKFNPLVLEEAAVVPSQVDVRTNEKGYAQIDLLQCGQYEVSIEGVHPEHLRCINVPDSPSCNLPDLLFARVERVTFAEAIPASGIILAVGETIELTPTVWDSAGRPLTGTAVSDVSWKAADSALLRVSAGPTKIQLRGNSTGSTQLLVHRLDASVIRIPNTPIIGVPIEVAVA